MITKEIYTYTPDITPEGIIPRLEPRGGRPNKPRQPKHNRKLKPKQLQLKIQ